MPTNGDYIPPRLTEQQKKSARYVGAINAMLARANRGKK